MNFAHPERLALLALIPMLLLLYYLSLKKRKRVAVKFANYETLEKITAHGKPLQKHHLSIALWMAALTLLVLALAHPQAEATVRTAQSDVVLAIDVSGSMRAEDYQPNRLEAAKQAAITFVDELKGGDRVGVVAFSGVSRIVSPLSGEKEVVKERIERVGFGTQDGTAIGDGLVSSVSLLSGSEERKRFVVLLSDGQNNRGVAPQDAAVYAEEQKVTVYTVGIGSPRGKTPEGEVTGLDQKTLKAIASATGGDYRLAESENDLSEVYSEIASTIGFDVRQRDVSDYFAFAALVTFSLQFALSAYRFRTLP